MRPTSISNAFAPVAQWFNGQTFSTLATAFVLLSLADLMATLQTVPTALLREGNGTANLMLQTYGIVGMVFYKSCLVFIVLGILWRVTQQKPRLAASVLWGALLLMGFVALYHLTIFAGLFVG